ncbi:MAG: DNA mismatch repair endonuclease MutL [Puniceicoccales bacterium]|jgi:DNA mismatch repair protein MutL|nr:DNA mismatch repair endonuclease MutL [Puniceicoccales bacterium]
MAKIHLLPETVINQIAAGEVIDRPASIVKELIENSIDARATHIVVKFNEGGDTLLSIADDGIGMDEMDAAMAFERNATSKLAAIRDLESLETFGFRGEAIASIASVARVTMQTNDGSGGTEIYYDSGKKIYQKACSCRQGTFIEIRNLFEKVPARKQYLRSTSTEAMHIIRTVRAFVLAEPEINFELYKNGKLLFSSPDSRDLRDRTELLFGHFDQYTALDYANDRVTLRGILYECAVDGMVSRPDFLIFVNKRNVNNPAIVRLVRDTYAMIKSRVTSVGAFLFLEFQGNFVDFNVHPQKKEVRFKSDFYVKNFIQNAIADAIQRRIATLNPGIPMDGLGVNNNASDAFTPTMEELSHPIHPFQRRKLNPITCRNVGFYSGNSGDDGKVQKESGFHQVFDLSLPQNLEHFPSELIENSLFWRFIGMFREGRFAIFEAATGLIFVDLMAAQRCILWDKFLNSPDHFIPQLLLVPRTITVTPERSIAVEACLEMLAIWGIEIERFGKNVYKITALPREISEEMVLQWLQDPSLTDTNKMLVREGFAKHFCGRFKFQPVQQDEVKGLIDQLLRCQQFMISPNDTNVLFEIDCCDLDKKFGLQLNPPAVSFPEAVNWF